MEAQPITEKPQTDFRQLFDGVTQHLRSLESLGETIPYWDTLLVCIIATKLDINSTKEWEELIIKQECSPTLDKLFSVIISQRGSVAQMV